MMFYALTNNIYKMTSFNIRFNEKIFKMKWHEEDFPEPDTVVICRVKQIDTYGVRVNILNYGGIEGFLATNELSRRKIKSIRSIIKVDDIKPLLVIKRETKGDQIYIDLSNKQISNAESEVERLEKYYRITNIIHTWLKYVYKKRHIIGGTYIGDLNNSIQMVVNIENKDELKDNTTFTIQNIKSYESLTKIAFDQEISDTMSDKKSEIDTMSETDAMSETDTKTNTKTNTKFETEITDSNNEDETCKTFPYGEEIWNKVMACTLWKYSVGDVPDIFLEIKTGKRGNGIDALKSAFPELVSKAENGELFADIDENQQIEITMDDLEILSTLIDKFINYDVVLKLNLKLTCWGINSLDTIGSILKKIQSIPDIHYESGFSYSSLVLNSPAYEFVIKSPKKALMDRIYPNGCSIQESEFGQHIIDILKSYDDDIDYEAEIERNDISL
jgi:hypothetical protein